MAPWSARLPRASPSQLGMASAAGRGLWQGPGASLPAQREVARAPPQPRAPRSARLPRRSKTSQSRPAAPGRRVSRRGAGGTRSHGRARFRRARGGGRMRRERRYKRWGVVAERTERAAEGSRGARGGRRRATLRARRHGVRSRSRMKLSLKPRGRKSRAGWRIFSSLAARWRVHALQRGGYSVPPRPPPPGGGPAAARQAKGPWRADAVARQGGALAGHAGPQRWTGLLQSGTRECAVAGPGQCASSAGAARAGAIE